jgi:hypothetical protein
MTKEEWDKVDAVINNPYRSITLMCDGYKLGLLSSVCKQRVVTMIFVNGEYRGGWSLKDCEERRRFHRRVVHSSYSPKEKVKYRKWGKRMLKEINIDLDRTWESYTCFWTSLRSLKAHLIKNNTSIELAPEV